MNDATETLVTSGQDSGDTQARIARLTQRVAANPDNIGLRLRLARLLEESGRYDDALRVAGDTFARFPRNEVARTRFEALRERARPAARPSPPEADAEFHPPQPPDQPAPPAPAPDRQFLAQAELLHLARVASGRPEPSPPAHTSPPPVAPADTRTADLQAEPALRLRLNPLSRRYRAEIYFAAAIVSVIVLCGIVVWSGPHTGLLIDHDAPTQITLAPPPADLSPAPPPSPIIPPATLPRVTRSTPDELAAPAPMLATQAQPAPATPSPVAPAPAAPAPAAPAPAAPAPATPSLVALPEGVALPEVTLNVPLHDARAASQAADIASRLRDAGIAVHTAASTGRQQAGVTYVYAEDAALARHVSEILGDEAGQVGQAEPAPGATALPGAIRITLPPLSGPRRPG